MCFRLYYVLVVYMAFCELSWFMAWQKGYMWWSHTHTQHTSLSCYVLWSKVKVCMSRKTTCIGIWFASCCTLIEGERETHLHFFLIDVINVHRWCTSFFAPDFWTVVKILFAMPQRFSLFISIQFTKFGFLIIIYCLSFCENVSYLTLKIFF